MRNTWLRVSLLANDHTGLAAPDVFYFGNLVGDTGDAAGATMATVSAADFSRTRARIIVPAPPDSPFDFNHDRRVDASDLAAVRGNFFQSLRLITAPAAPTVSGAQVAMTTDPAVITPGGTASASARRRTWYNDQPDLLGRVA